MKVLYLREVKQPHCIAGPQWYQRELPDHQAKQLIKDGFAEAVPETEVKAEPVDVVARPARVKQKNKTLGDHDDAT